MRGKVHPCKGRDSRTESEQGRRDGGDEEAGEVQGGTLRYLSQHCSVSTCHLVNISIRLGRRLTWDRQQQVCVGDDEANRWPKRKQRKGFEIHA